MLRGSKLGSLLGNVCVCSADRDRSHSLQLPKRLAIERIVKLLRKIHADDLAADLITEYKLPEQIQ